MASSLLPSEGDVGWAAKANNAISAPQVNGFRLTGLTGVPVPTSDISPAPTSIFLTPYTSDRICLFDGTNWQEYSTPQISLVLSVTAGNNYDVFVFDNAGTPTLELSVAWTSNTSRAPATDLVRQNGVWVKSGATTRRYVGTIRASAANTTADSNAQRYIWNVDNRVLRGSRQSDPNTWNATVSAATANDAGNGNWKHEFVVGWDEETYHVHSEAWIQSTNGNTDWYIGLDSVSAATDSVKASSAVAATSVITQFRGYIGGIGYHFFQGSNQVATGVTATFLGGYQGFLTMTRR